MKAPPVAGVTVRPASSARGRLQVPGDKSISHRYAMLAALADGTTRIDGYSSGADCAATLACLRALGVDISVEAAVPEGASTATLTIEGRGLGGLAAPAADLDTANSGTTMRLMAGILAGHPFQTRLTGDASLSRRPMRRIIDPLRLMGATVEATEADRPPLTVHGAPLRGIDYSPTVASAQVKSAILLAGLHANGSTTVREPTPTRDHTERALHAFGGSVEQSAGAVSIEGGHRLTGARLRVPGDLSSAAYWVAAAVALPGSDLEIEDVGLNPTRTALLDVLIDAGAAIERHETAASGAEPRGSLRVRHARLAPIEIEAVAVPGLIDELPVLAALATHGTDVSVRGAGELRAKESDRISALVAGLRALGADVEEFDDGFHARPAGPLRGGEVDAVGDHRLAMSFAIAALGATGPVHIVGADVVDVSYPGFFERLEGLCH